jgi:phage/plasmid-like protein (TIGR03299 family)
MAHCIETAMFVGKPAWHGLGTVLNAPPTVVEAIKLAGLDWTVEMENVYLSDDMGRAEVPGIRAVVRMSDSKILGTVGDKFHTVQNSDAFAWFQPFLDADLVTIEAAGSLKGGQRVWILAKVKGGSAEVVKGDEVVNYLLLAHGHDGSLSMWMGSTPTRVVCQNTLSAAILDGRGNGLIRAKHTKNLTVAMERARETIIAANARFADAMTTYRALANVRITDAQMKEYIDKVFPPAKKELAAKSTETGGEMLSSLLARPVAPKPSIFSADGGEITKEARQRIYSDILPLFHHGRGNAMPGVAGTAWGGYNAVTEYLTHERGRTADANLNTAWFGAESTRAIQAAETMFLGK